MYVVECSCVENELYEACDLYEEIVVPAFNKDTWKADGWWYAPNKSKEATCQMDGAEVYGYSVKSTIEGVKELAIYYTVVLPAGEHKQEVPPAEQTWTYEGYVYTGYYCGTCGKMIVTNKVAA